ncbi:unnamed protein product [Alternaria alternata]
MSQAPKLEEKQPFEVKEVTYSTKALETTMMEPPPFSEERMIDELLKNPTYLVMKQDRWRCLWQHYKYEEDYDRTTDMIDIVSTVPYLHSLVTTSIDPRAMIGTDYDNNEWLDYLASTRLPVFPWEHSMYVRIYTALRSSGIRPKGGLAGLIKTKKISDSLAQEKGMDFCPLPFDAFHIDDGNLASKWFHITPIPHPRTADDFDDKVVDLHRILEHVRTQPKVDIEELTERVIYGTNALEIREAMEQLLKATGIEALEKGIAGVLKHLGLLRPNSEDTRATAVKLEYGPPPPLSTEGLGQDFTNRYDPYHIIRLLQQHPFEEIRNLLNRYTNANLGHPSIKEVLRIEACESCDRPLQL